MVQVKEKTQMQVEMAKWLANEQNRLADQKEVISEESITVVIGDEAEAHISRAFDMIANLDVERGRRDMLVQQASELKGRIVAAKNNHKMLLTEKQQYREALKKSPRIAELYTFLDEQKKLFEDGDMRIDRNDPMWEQFHNAKRAIEEVVDAELAGYQTKLDALSAEITRLEELEQSDEMSDAIAEYARRRYVG